MSSSMVSGDIGKRHMDRRMRILFLIRIGKRDRRSRSHQNNDWAGKTITLVKLGWDSGKRYISRALLSHKEDLVV